MPEPAHKGGRKASYHDLMEVPDHLVAEIINGELVTSPRPASPHALASTAIASRLFGAFYGEKSASGDGPGGWWILDEPEIHLGEDVVVPDLAGWRRERMPLLPNVAAFDMAPDWVCEVVSPSTARMDRVHKMPIYAREKVSHMWLVDPLAQTLEVFRLEADRWVVVSSHAGAEKVHAQPFDAVELDMTRWWLPSGERASHT